MSNVVATDSLEGAPVGGAPVPALALEGLRRRYGAQLVLDGLSLSVAPGEVYGFLGRNGAGKTTTLRGVMGIVAFEAGQVRLFGEPVRAVGPAHKRRMGYVSQEQHFYPWMSARELGRFVRGFYPTWDDAQYEALLKRLEVPPETRSAALSQGTRTKLALALALAHRPPLLLLDEPTAGLDPVVRREFNELVRQRAQESQTAVLFSSHLVEELEPIAGRVGILHGGRIRAEGSPAQLCARVRALPGVESLPEGFVRLHGELVEAPEEAWAAFPQAQPLPLAEVFIAYARSPAR